MKVSDIKLETVEKRRRGRNRVASKILNIRLTTVEDLDTTLCRLYAAWVQPINSRRQTNWTIRRRGTGGLPGNKLAETALINPVVGWNLTLTGYSQPVRLEPNAFVERPRRLQSTSLERLPKGKQKIPNKQISTSGMFSKWDQVNAPRVFLGAHRAADFSSVQSRLLVSWSARLI